MKTKSVKIIDVYDFDELVQNTYKRPYDLQQQNGCMDRQTIYFSVPNSASDFENDTIPEEVNGDKKGVSFKSWLARDPYKKLDTDEEWAREHGLDLFWSRNFYPDFQTLVNDLHSKGLLESGDYGIKIDW